MLYRVNTFINGSLVSEKLCWVRISGSDYLLISDFLCRLMLSIAVLKFTFDIFHPVTHCVPYENLYSP